MPPLPKSQAESEHVQDIPPQIPVAFGPRNIHYELWQLNGSQVATPTHHQEQMRREQNVSGVDDGPASRALPVPSIRIYPPPQTQDCNCSADSIMPAPNHPGGDASRKVSRATQDIGMLKVPGIGLRQPRRLKDKVPSKLSEKRAATLEGSTEHRKIVKKRKRSSSPRPWLDPARTSQLESAIEQDQRILYSKGDDISNNGCSRGHSGFENAIAESSQAVHQTLPSDLRSPSHTLKSRKDPPVFTFELRKEHSPSLAPKARKGSLVFTYEFCKERCIGSSRG
ncbi:hypothetical protein DL98DRAFT_532681 [Cadophora sp. DSE1049]|nr:hypothetical protein DL98DRAFT_532681 [Cadophora sp. DSE1049]